MSVGLTITVIAAALILGTHEGKRRQRAMLGADAHADIDDCPTVYADEEGCECPDEEMLSVDLNERGHAICTNCGRRRL